MALAMAAGKESEDAGLGRNVGAVLAHGNKLVAVAGDARWWKPSQDQAEQNSERTEKEDNPLAHAAMRAIAFVGRHLRQSQPPSLSPEEEMNEDQSFFASSPLTMVEKLYSSKQDGDKDPQNTIESSIGEGYLCLNLDVYLTHEPCVMCAMAMLHSRVGRIIYAERMNGTGALCAEVVQGNGNKDVEGGLGYGLFWRKELNWRCLAWEYEVEGLSLDSCDNNRIPFHACICDFETRGLSTRAALTDFYLSEILSAQHWSSDTTSKHEDTSSKLHVIPVTRSPS